MRLLQRRTLPIALPLPQRWRGHRSGDSLVAAEIFAVDHSDHNEFTKDATVSRLTPPSCSPCPRCARCDEPLFLPLPSASPAKAGAQGVVQHARPVFLIPAFAGKTGKGGLRGAAITTAPEFPNPFNTPPVSRPDFPASPQACATLPPSRRTEGS